MMIAIRRTLLLCTLWPGTLTAQRSTGDTRISDLLGGDMTLSVTPGYDRVSLGGRSTVDTRMAWPGRRDGSYAVALGLELGATRFGLHSYVRSAVDAQLLKRAGINTWFGVAGAAGNGSGPRQTFQLNAGMQVRSLSAGLRAGWLEVSDSLQAGGIEVGQPRIWRNYIDAEASATRHRGSLALTLTTGRRFGSFAAQRSWAFATLTVPVRERIGLALASGWRPDQPERAQPHGAFAQIALRFDLRGATERSFPRADDHDSSDDDDQQELSLRVSPLVGGYRLRLRASAAQRVELKGDLTNWDVKELHKTSDAYWELEVDAKPGVYLINIRVNGQLWTVPAGLVAVSDSFGGLAGVLNLQ